MVLCVAEVYISPSQLVFQLRPPIFPATIHFVKPPPALSSRNHRAESNFMSSTATSIDLLREVNLMQYTQGVLIACRPKIGLVLSRREGTIEIITLIYFNSASGTAMFLYEFGEYEMLLPLYHFAHGHPHKTM